MRSMIPMSLPKPIHKVRLKDTPKPLWKKSTSARVKIKITSYHLAEQLFPNQAVQFPSQASIPNLNKPPLHHVAIHLLTETGRSNSQSKRHGEFFENTDTRSSDLQTWLPKNLLRPWEGLGLSISFYGLLFAG